MQKHVRDEFPKELSLLLDTKAKWSSLFSILERFCLIRNAIRKGFKDLKLQPSIVFTQYFSQRCASSASSQSANGSYVSTRFKSSDSRRCIEVHAQETESSEDFSWY